MNNVIDMVMAQECCCAGKKQNPKPDIVELSTLLPAGFSLSVLCPNPNPECVISTQQVLVVLVHVSAVGVVDVQYCLLNGFTKD